MDPGLAPPISGLPEIGAQHGAQVGYSRLGWRTGSPLRRKTLWRYKTSTWVDTGVRLRLRDPRNGECERNSRWRRSIKVVPHFRGGHDAEQTSPARGPDPFRGPLARSDRVGDGPEALRPGGIRPAQAAGKPILIEVSAPWCPTCKAQAPILSRLSNDGRFKELVRFNVDFDSRFFRGGDRGPDCSSPTAVKRLQVSIFQSQAMYHCTAYIS